MPRPHAPLRLFLAGLVTGLAALLIGLASVARFLPDAAAVQAIGRTLDSVAPHLLAAAMVLALGVWVLGQARVALGVLLLAGLSIGGLAVQHISRSAPLAAEAPTDLTILWFNIWADNTQSHADLAEGLRASGADVLVLSEAARLEPVMALLAELYPHQLGCETWCQVAVLSKYPLEDVQRRRLSVASEERFVQVRLSTPAGDLTLVAAHVIKPWFDRLATDEARRLVERVRSVEGPVVLAGDMNAAPWSRRMLDLVDQTNLRFARVPPATWPVAAGPLGVPIDNMLVGQGARFVGLTAWGAGMGSNHLGILAEITLR